jgi:hypothetical protein
MPLALYIYGRNAGDKFDKYQFPGQRARVILYMRIIFRLILLLIVPAASGQREIPRDSLPGEVRLSFEQHFSGAVSTWFSSGTGQYRCELDMPAPTSIVFNKKGQIVASRRKSSIAELPNSVARSTAIMYPSFRIEECSLYATPDSGMMYEVTIHADRTTFTLVFDAETNCLVTKR